MDASFSDNSNEEFEQNSWISEYLSATGHELFAEVSEDFIDDDFNLTGLGALVPHYHEALEMILDLEPEYPAKLPSVAVIEQSAEVLYGLIHARFITSRQGLNIMVQKYDYADFGTCPRVLCQNTKLLPFGRHDLPGCETVKFFCPCCTDIYQAQSSRYMNVDGAFFGTTFAGLFLKNFPTIERNCLAFRKDQFALTMYGFKISEYSQSGPRMKWLRQHPENIEELDDFALLRQTGGSQDGDDGDEDGDEDAMQIDTNNSAAYGLPANNI